MHTLQCSASADLSTTHQVASMSKAVCQAGMLIRKQIMCNAAYILKGVRGDAVNFAAFCWRRGHVKMRPHKDFEHHMLSFFITVNSTHQVSTNKKQTSKQSSGASLAVVQAQQWCELSSSASLLLNEGNSDVLHHLATMPLILLDVQLPVACCSIAEAHPLGCCQV